MNFLELVQELHSLSGSSSTQPVSTVGQSGQLDRLVRFVRNADFNWQTRWLNWHFLFKQTSSGFTLTPDRTTAPPSDLFTWDTATFRVRESANDDWIPVNSRPYSDVKGGIFTTDTGLPFEAYVLPDRSLRFDPIPDQAYLFQSDYWRRPVRLIESADVSPIPDEYHLTVVLGTALLYYGYFEDAPELRQEAMGLIEQGRPQLESHELPDTEAEWLMGSTIRVGTDAF